MDEKAREADRRFAAGPSAEGAAALLQQALRSGGWPAVAGRWVLDASRWDVLPVELQELAARCLAGAMAPRGFTFEGLTEQELGGTSHRVATFARKGRSYALVPGGCARLGLDPKSLRPTPAQLEDVRGYAEIYGFDVSGGVEPFLHEHLARSFTEPREVTIEPFLMEVEARPVESLCGDEDLDGELELSDGAGGRLPTADEWEWACGGGNPRLFRWGDDCPADLSPYGENAFDLHRRRNAFGLLLPSDTYKTELCQGRRLRGGNGGGTICGGGTHYLAWLVLATAYDYTAQVEELGLSLDECNPIARFVHSLPGVEGVQKSKARRVPPAKKRPSVAKKKTVVAKKKKAAPTKRKVAKLKAKKNTKK